MNVRIIRKGYFKYFGRPPHVPSSILVFLHHHHRTMHAASFCGLLLLLGVFALAASGASTLLPKAITALGGQTAAESLCGYIQLQLLSKV